VLSSRSDGAKVRPLIHSTTDTPSLGSQATTSGPTPARAAARALWHSALRSIASKVLFPDASRATTVRPDDDVTW